MPTLPPGSSASFPSLRRLRRNPSLAHLLPLLSLFLFVHNTSSSSFSSSSSSSSTVLDNSVLGDPQVHCMEDRVKLTFRTQRPFTGRIFVKGMVDNDKCVANYQQNSRNQVDFELTNGQCNMRRSRKLGPEQRGVEQSITVIISFHDIFITKVDRAYRCTCFYMEADKVVTNRFDVSMIPTTDLIDTARMPLCTYTVRRGSVNGPIVSYATVGEPVFHVWNCDSDMFSMLVHNCFVDDGAGKDRKPLIDEHGCTIDPAIVSELTYNSQANLAYSEVNVFKFADKVTTYFQCAVSTCMISEGMCSGKTPPHCGPNSRRRRTIDLGGSAVRPGPNGSAPFAADDPFTMDLSADKIVVLDLDDVTGEEASTEKSGEGRRRKERERNRKQAVLAAASRLNAFTSASLSGSPSVCLGHSVVFVVLSIVALAVTGTGSAAVLLLWRQRRKAKDSCQF